MCTIQWVLPNPPFLSKHMVFLFPWSVFGSPFLVSAPLLYITSNLIYFHSYFSRTSFLPSSPKYNVSFLSHVFSDYFYLWFSNFWVFVTSYYTAFCWVPFICSLIFWQNLWNFNHSFFKLFFCSYPPFSCLILNLIISSYKLQKLLLF